MDEKDRVEIVKNLKSVDEVLLSIDKDKTVSKSLEKLKPSVFANGGDRKNYEIPESKICTEHGIEIIDGLLTVISVIFEIDIHMKLYRQITFRH